ncbi:RluA family pseudouridine synthase [Staphylococcus argenteus]|uniref:RluA family pseudouridine synthase n=1 Tax=Staphylococcus argenteus TaxID=985002 RepID=UPI00178CC8F3|nr:RluA family pseudouridine synthase [Staphylococcus argenteus]MBE2145648.1 RluA family pseudouridine synthase [Staphylococcus argenteus]
MKFTYQITQQETVKTFLARHDFSKKTVSAIKHNGALIVNGQHVTVRKVLMPEDTLVIHLPIEIHSSNMIPFDRPLEVIYEDTYIILVTKPKNQNCTPSREHPHESLIEQVLHYCQDKGENINPHIVTHLDRDTTGIVIFAKYGHIHHLFSKVKLEKVYTCLAYGKTKLNDVIEANIRRSNDSIITREVAEDGKYAKTSYEVLTQNDKYSLCKVYLHTGRTHQIRVHFQYIGHSLVGDSLYGGSHERVQGQTLQCTQVNFVHPITKNDIAITIDYKQLLNLFNEL